MPTLSPTRQTMPINLKHKNRKKKLNRSRRQNTAKHLWHIDRLYELFQSCTCFAGTNLLMSLFIWSIFQLVVYFHRKKKTKKNPSLNLVITYCSPVSEEGTRKGRGRCVLVTAMYFNMRQQQC